MEALMTRKPSPGDRVEIVGHRVGDAPRDGEILEVLGPDSHPHFRVRWEDGHVSLLFPGADVAVTRGSARRSRSSAAKH
jgi:uncharacterized protein DUF1918